MKVDLLSVLVEKKSPTHPLVTPPKGHPYTNKQSPSASQGQQRDVTAHVNGCASKPLGVVCYTAIDNSPTQHYSGNYIFLQNLFFYRSVFLFFHNRFSHSASCHQSRKSSCRRMPCSFSLPCRTRDFTEDTEASVSRPISRYFKSYK